ncbi:hypothetical protein [Paracoccus pacificus]|uniref:Glycosyltransferase n=1 Tax=Paracoccus pacificus TaxID=1463598 RepID=A0ABW4R799_9RHOB
MIRAHLATFPPRQALVPNVVRAILPQVDRLFVVLNGYDEIPGYLADEEKVTAIIPDRDVKDAGKFWFRPDPDDIVFLIDDDLGYPPDYVSTTIAAAEAIGWEYGAFGHIGLIWRDEKMNGLAGWQLFRFHRENRKSKGMDLLCTNATVARGAAIPPMEMIEPFAGYVDIGLATYLRDLGLEMWLLPHGESWLTNDLPPELFASSLLATHAHSPPPMVKQAIHRLIADAPPNRGIPVHKFTRSGAGKPAHQE